MTEQHEDELRDWPGTWKLGHDGAGRICAERSRAEPVRRVYISPDRKRVEMAWGRAGRVQIGWMGVK